MEDSENLMRVSAVSEAMPEVRWTRSAAEVTRPPWLQQYWKITEHFRDSTSTVRYEWRDVPTVPPYDAL